MRTRDVLLVAIAGIAVLLTVGSQILLGVSDMEREMLLEAITPPDPGEDYALDWESALAPPPPAGEGGPEPDSHGGETGAADLRLIPTSKEYYDARRAFMSGSAELRDSACQSRGPEFADAAAAAREVLGTQEMHPVTGSGYWYGVAGILAFDAYCASLEGDAERSAVNAAALAELIGAAVAAVQANQVAQLTHLMKDLLLHLYSGEAIPPEVRSAIMEISAKRPEGAIIARDLRKVQYEYKVYIEDWMETDLGESVEEAGLYWGVRNWLWTSRACRTLFNEDVKRTMGYFDAMIALVENPRADTVEALEGLRTEMESLGARFPMAQHMGHLVDRALMTEKLPPSVLLLQLSTHLHDYQITHGHYPPTLEALGLPPGSESGHGEVTYLDYTHGFFLEVEELTWDWNAPERIREESEG